MALSSLQSLGNQTEALAQALGLNALEKGLNSATNASNKERASEHTEMVMDQTANAMGHQAARGEAGRALSDFTAQENFRNSIQQSMNSATKGAADLIKSAAN